jgi:hypothetical protein
VLNFYRICFVVALVPFVLAFIAPVHDYTVGRSNVLIPGFMLAKYGILGPLEFCFAWYANIPLMHCGWKMICGEPPVRLLAWIAAVLALSAFAPQFIAEFETTGKFVAHWFYGAAVWLWCSTFLVVLIVAYMEPVLLYFRHRE